MTGEALRERLAAGRGVIRCRPGERAAVSRASARGQLVRLLPGVYCEPGLAADFETRARALHLLDPDALLVGRAAARATWWPDLPVPEVVATDEPAFVTDAVRRLARSRAAALGRTGRTGRHRRPGAA